MICPRQREQPLVHSELLMWESKLIPGAAWWIWAHNLVCRIRMYCNNPSGSTSTHTYMLDGSKVDSFLNESRTLNNQVLIWCKTWLPNTCYAVTICSPSTSYKSQEPQNRVKERQSIETFSDSISGPRFQCCDEQCTVQSTKQSRTFWMLGSWGTFFYVSPTCACVCLKL